MPNNENAVQRGFCTHLASDSSQGRCAPKIRDTMLVGRVGGDFDGIFPDTQTGQHRGADDVFTCMRATDGGALSF